MANPRLDFFLLGIFGIIALYHAVLYSFESRRRAPLYLAVFCLLMSLRLFTVNGYLREAFPEFVSPIFVVKMERLAAVLSVPVFAFYLHGLMGTDIWKRFARWALLLCLPFVVFAFLPDALYGRVTTFHHVYEYLVVFGLLLGTALLLRRVLRERDITALLLLAGFLILGCAAGAQMLAGRRWITFANYLQGGMAGFILIQVLIIARENSRTRRRAENLSLRLEETNAGLEEKVRERTADLKAALEELSGKLALLDGEKSPPGQQAPGAEQRLLAFKERGGHHVVLPVYEIIYLSSHKDNTVIHGDSREHETVALLKDMEARLPGSRFVRIHKQFVVNVDRIARMEYMAGGNYMLILKDAEESRLPVGRKYAPALKKRLGLGASE